MDAPAFDANSLPALCDTAIRDLAEVRDIGQCLQIRDLGIAARIYAEKHKMAQDAQDACQRIVAMAEKRIGLELAAAQQRGELASQGEANKPYVPDGNVSPATYAEIGITRRQAHDFKRMASLSDDDINEVFDDAKERGTPVKKSDLKRKADGKRQEQAPTMPPRPDHLNHLALLIRNMAGVIPKFMDHREAMSLAGRYGVQFDPDQVETIMNFTAALLTGLKADRAA